MGNDRVSEYREATTRGDADLEWDDGFKVDKDMADQFPVTYNGESSGMPLGEGVEFSPHYDEVLNVPRAKYRNREDALKRMRTLCIRGGFVPTEGIFFTAKWWSQRVKRMPTNG